MDEDIAKLLDQPLAPALVSQRKGPGGKMLDYIEGYSAIDQANRIFGYDGWSYYVDSYGQVTTADGYFYEARVTIHALGCVRQDLGFCEIQRDRDGLWTVDAFDMAMKGAVTDAVKRALRTFGAQFGNSLYAKTPSTIPAQPPHSTTSSTAGDDSEWCPKCGKHKNAKFKLCYSCNQQAKDAPEKAPEEASAGPAEPWEAFVQEVEAAGLTLQEILPRGSETIDAFTSIGGTLELARKRHSPRRRERNERANA